MALERRPSVLERFDELQNKWVLIAVLPVGAAADAFCTFDHFAPWSRILMGAFVLILVASVALHGLWRLRLNAAPIVAIVLLLAAGFALVSWPFALVLSWAALGRFVGEPSSLPWLVVVVTANISFLVALFLVLRISERESVTPSRPRSADK